jgi:hypothetical protein
MRRMVMATGSGGGFEDLMEKRSWCEEAAMMDAVAVACLIQAGDLHHLVLGMQYLSQDNQSHRLPVGSRSTRAVSGASSS